MQHLPLDTSLGGKTELVIRIFRAAGVSACILHVAVSCGYLYPDQVPAWWCLDLDSFMLWVEWPMLT